MYRRLIAYNPARKLQQWFVVDDDGLIHIETTQDVDALLDQNRALLNDATGPMGDMAQTAALPEIIVDDLMRTGAFHDEAYMKKFLNDPDNRKLRTRPGRV